MSLRTKLTLTLVGIVIPVMLAFAGFRFFAERSAARDRVTDRILARLEARGPGRCVNEPQRFELRGRPFTAYAYGPGFTSANPGAPEFPEALAEALGDSESATTWSWETRGFSSATAVRTPWPDTSCSALLVMWREQFGPHRARVMRSVLVQSGVLLVVLVITGLVAGGPLVRRIRRLTNAIQDSDGRWRIENEIDAGDELGELARAFNEAGRRVDETVEELEERDQALREFIANTTHDLSVPLTVLQHRLTRLARHLDDRDEAAELVDSSLEESHYIASLISNLGTAARLDAGEAQMTRHDTSLNEIVMRVGSRHEPIATQKEIELNWALPPREVIIEADSTFVEQAIGNCVQNAIQYNAEGGHVSVILEAYDDHFEIQIIDDGPGIPDEVRDRITERTFRDDRARTRHPGGRGFGLAIARRVVDVHDWTITFENRTPSGLEVTIRGQSQDS